MIYTVNEASKPVVESAKKTTNFASILFESEQNSMMIFEAALACDFHEIKGLREGTIVSSELSALQEKTAKEFMHSVWEAIKKAAEKVLNALASVMRSIGQWIIKTATPLADRFDKVYDEHKRDGVKFEDLKCEWIDLDKLADKYNLYGLSEAGFEVMEKYAGYKYAEGGRTSAHNIATGIFREYIGGDDSDIAPAEFIARAMEKSIEEKNIKVKADLDPALNLLRKNDAIKALRSTEAALRKDLNAVKKELNSEKENNADAVSAVASAYQTAINAFTNLHVKAVKYDLKAANTLVHKAIIAMEGVKESVDYTISVVESEFDTEMETVPGEAEVEPKYDDAVNALIAASEPEGEPAPAVE